MSTLAELDAARGGPMHYRVRGEIHRAPDPRLMPHDEILEAIYFGALPIKVAMTLRQRGALLERWRAHYDIPDLDRCQRLMYLLDHYADAIDYDLQAYAGVDMGELFRARRWGRLLNLITHLPRDSHYSEAAAQDPEHIAAIVRSLAERGTDDVENEAASGPPLHSWSPELAAITDVLDAVRNLSWTVVAAQAGAAKAGDRPKPAPRPVTGLERALKRSRFEERKAKHDALARRLLPKKRRQEAE